MAQGAPSQSGMIGIWVLRVILGFVFLYVGTTKLTATAHSVDYFAAIGWGQWFRYLTGVLDIIGAVLLLVPGRTFIGALVLICSVGTGALIALTVLRADPTWGSPAMVAVPLALTLLAVLLAWLTRPHRAG